MHFQKLKLPREEVVSIQSLKKMCLGAKLFFKCGGGSLEFSQNFELRVSGKTHSIQFLTSNDMLSAMCSMYVLLQNHWRKDLSRLNRLYCPSN